MTATKKETLPAELDALFAEDSGKGFEEVTSADIQIPFLRIIQQMSPQINKKEAGFIEGELLSSSREVASAERNQETGMEMLSSGNELVRTAQYYIKIVHEDGTLENAIVDMKKTQLKKSRLWMSMQMMQKRNGITLPSYACTYRLKTIEDGNDKGNWNTWSIAHEGMIPSVEAYNDCKELHGSISSGSLQIAPPPSEELLESPKTSSEDDIPF